MTIDFSGFKLKRNSKLIRILRLMLKLLPGSLVVPIIQGPLCGRKWILKSGNHSCWLGTYEFEIVNVIEKLIKKGNVVFDIGAHVGYYSLFFSNQVGEKGKVYSFEPMPRNIRFLRRNMALNRALNVKIIESAISDENGSGEFLVGKNSYIGKLALASGNNNNAKINCLKTSIDSFVLKEGIERVDFMKIDTEGEEYRVLKGAKQILCSFMPILFLSIHQTEMSAEIRNYLRTLGYNIKSAYPIDDDRNEKNILAIPTDSHCNNLVI